MTVVLEMTAATRAHGRYMAVLDAHLRLGPGVHGLLGPNGAGKTTLLKLASGLLRPTSGSVKWWDGAGRRDPALHNGIMVCIDGEELPPDDTPTELLTFLLRCAGEPAHDAENRAEAVLRDFGLQQQMERRIGTLSRGQRQRVKLAHAFSHPARLLLLDEPLNALDPVWRLKVIEKVKKAAADGACVLLSSHVLHEVEAVTERMILMFKGRIVAAGTREQIHELVHKRGLGLAVACSDPRALAAALMRCPAVGSTQIQDNVLQVQSDDLEALSLALPAAVLEAGVVVERVQADGDDLVGMFTALAEQIR